MAQFLGAEVVLNGSTWVEVVDAPASGKQRQILSLKAKNRDTTAHTMLGRKVKGGSNYEQFQIEVAAGLEGQLMPTGCVVLDAADESYEVKSDGAASTTEPLVDVAFFEVP